MELRSKDFISSHCSEQTEVFLDHIKKLKNEYQDEIEEMVDMFSPVLADPEVLDKWTQEVKDIGILVKKHAIENILSLQVLRSVTLRLYLPSQM